MSGRALLFVYAALNVAAYSMLLPLWEGFDEPFHFGYVQTLANGDGFPDPRTSPLSQEIASSLLLAPASLSVKRNIPEVPSYDEFFRRPEAERRRAHQELANLDPRGRRQPGHFLDYEALQAPLAYAVLALPERALANVPLPYRVLALRMIGGWLGVFLLLAAADRLTRRLNIARPYSDAVLFCAMSSQMLLATVAHVANDWLAVPLALWAIVLTIDYYESPTARRIAAASALLAVGLLTKAYFLAFLPVLAFLCILRKRWRDLALAAAVVAIAAGPWYARNLKRYQSLSGMQELRGGGRIREPRCWIYECGVCPPRWSPAYAPHYGPATTPFARFQPEPCEC